MDLIWLTSAALFVAIYCLIFFCYQASKLRKCKFNAAPGISFLFLVKNQEQVVEGLIQTCLFGKCSSPVEIIVLDLGSGDQTEMILNRLVRQYQNLRYLKLEPDGRLPGEINQHCSGQTIHCLSLTGCLVDYHVMADHIRSILSQKSKNRTNVLNKTGLQPDVFMEK